MKTTTRLLQCLQTQSLGVYDLKLFSIKNLNLFLTWLTDESESVLNPLQRFHKTLLKSVRESCMSLVRVCASDINLLKISL